MFLYHIAGVETIQTILQEGLSPSASTYRDQMESNLATVAEQNNISLPVTRQNAVFCYILFHEVVDSLRFSRGLHTGEKRQGAVVIDAEGIKEEMYVADFDYFSDVIDLRHMETPNDVMRSESYENALINYANSVTPVTAYESVADIDGEHRTTEVLIENGISASRIEEVIFFGEIDAEGYTSSYPFPPIS